MAWLLGWRRIRELKTLGLDNNGLGLRSCDVDRSITEMLGAGVE